MERVCNLLIVDDDLGHVALLRILLKSLALRHRCEHVSNGSLALQFLRRQEPFQNATRPSLILLDLQLPGKSGCEVLREIKSDPATRAIPVIVLSTSRRSDDVDACYNEHANAYISKARDLDEALQMLSAINQFWVETVELPGAN